MNLLGLSSHRVKWSPHLLLSADSGRFLPVPEGAAQQLQGPCVNDLLQPCPEGGSALHSALPCPEAIAQGTLSASCFAALQETLRPL